MINFLHFIDEDLEGFGKYAKLRSHGARIGIYVYQLRSLLYHSPLESWNVQEYPKQTGSWRTLRPKKKKEDKFHQLLENDVKLEDEQEGKTMQILFASNIYKENDLRTRKSKTRKETRPVLSNQQESMRVLNSSRSYNWYPSHKEICKYHLKYFYW